MKRIVSFAFLFVSFAVVAVAQTGSGEARFPGISAKHLTQLRTAKRSTALPLPTWLPAGFTLETVKMKLGPKVSLEFKELEIVYSRKLANGKTQRFSLAAGFDGLGGLPYDATHKVTSSFGQIELMYEPKDEDGSKIREYAITEWFTVGKTSFHYVGMYSENPDDGTKGLAMIPLADTQRILKSLQRF